MIGLEVFQNTTMLMIVFMIYFNYLKGTILDTLKYKKGTIVIIKKMKIRNFIKQENIKYSIRINTKELGYNPITKIK